MIQNHAFTHKSLNLGNADEKLEYIYLFTVDDIELDCPMFLSHGVRIMRLLKTLLILSSSILTEQCKLYLGSYKNHRTRKVCHLIWISYSMIRAYKKCYFSWFFGFWKEWAYSNTYIVPCLKFEISSATTSKILPFDSETTLKSCCTFFCFAKVELYVQCAKWVVHSDQRGWRNLQTNTLRLIQLGTFW